MGSWPGYPLTIMKYHKIYNLDCSDPKAKRALVKKVVEAIHFEERPTLDELVQITNRIQKRYKIPIQLLLKLEPHKWFLSIKYNKEGYITMYCQSKYEALCKYVLYAKERYKEKKNVL